MVDIYRFKDGELLVWTTRNTHAFFATGGAEIKQITGLKWTGQ